MKLHLIPMKFIPNFHRKGHDLINDWDTMEHKNKLYIFSVQETKKKYMIL